MTGPNPDAELDAALGINQLPPATVTDDHMRQALRALFPPARFTPADVPDLEPGTRGQVERVAQALADEGQRAVARHITELYTAGTGTTPPVRLDGAGDFPGRPPQPNPEEPTPPRQRHDHCA